MLNNFSDEYDRGLNELFSREARITVRNNLNTTLIRTNMNTKNGHYKKGAYGGEEFPATRISPGATIAFVVNNEGVSYVKGPEGSVTYTTSSPLKGVSDVKIVIYWEHPLGPTKSTYNVYSVPAGLIKYTLNPPAGSISGWKQDIEITISEA